MERISDIELERYQLDVQGILDNINEKSEEEGTFEVYQLFKEHDWWFAPSSEVEDLKYHLEEAASLLSSLQQHKH